jgi:hypothetical protein
MQLFLMYKYVFAFNPSENNLFFFAALSCWYSSEVASTYPIEKVSEPIPGRVLLKTKSILPTTTTAHLGQSFNPRESIMQYLAF